VRSKRPSIDSFVGQSASCLLPPASCLLPSAFCLLPPSFCLLPPASFLLPPASCLLPSTFCYIPPVSRLVSPSSHPAWRRSRVKPTLLSCRCPSTALTSRRPALALVPPCPVTPGQVGSLCVRLGLGWSKSISFHTGQCPGMIPSSPSAAVRAYCDSDNLALAF